MINRVVSTAYTAVNAPAIRERKLQDSIVQTSRLDWTIARIRVLTDAAPQITLNPAFDPKGSLLAPVSRGDFVRWLVVALDDPTTYGRNVYV
jgi:uncharacterized protein YbjT (DUF2867 family)